MEQRNFKPKFQKRQEHKINGFINYPSIRVIGDNIESKICSTAEAIILAESLEMDLVEINNKTNPPICRIVDYGKFLYEQKKKEKELSQNNQLALKEIKLGPHTHDNDLGHKSKKAIDFLKSGHKLKLSMLFRGREITYKEQGEIVMLKFIQMLEEYGKPEFMPKFEGKNLFVTITPKGVK